MKEKSWYLSMWFVAIMFSLWFLILPLIIGVILLIRMSKETKDSYNKINEKKARLHDWEEALIKKEQELEAKVIQETEGVMSLINAREAELLRQKKDLIAREREAEKLVAQKQKEVSLIDLAQQIRMVPKIKEKEKKLLLQEKALIKREQELETKIIQETETFMLLVKAKENELLHQKNTLIERERESKKLVAQKQKEISLIDLIQQIRTIPKIREKETELLLQKEALINKEQELEAKMIQETERFASLVKAREEELLHQKKVLIERERELEKRVTQKQREINLIDLTQQIRMIPKIRKKEEELLYREIEINKREHELEDIKRQILILEKKKVNLEDELLLQSFGFYDNKFFLENSEEYLGYLNIVRSKQKQLVKEKRATEYDVISLEERRVFPGSTQSKQQIKLAIRSFNNECDVAISKVKFNNVEVAEKKIRSSFYDINKLNEYNSISITEEYLQLKLEELFLVHEYSEKKQEEKEEQRRINELIREEKRAQRELEDELKKIKKEEQHLLNAISQLSSQISEQEMHQYKNRLEKIREQKEQVDYRVKNTRAGYVYVISNIGCFGENVYKIGMTRRLEPMDRVKELGGASVPFHFDVHAIIFSKDAPSLEASLHRAFHHRRVNRINERKEFFRVNLSEIKKVVHQSHNSFIEFTMIAEAKEYRETQALEKQFAKQHII